MNKLPDHLPRRYIIEAIHLWDAGETHQFQPARLYEIEYHTDVTLEGDCWHRSDIDDGDAIYPCGFHRRNKI